MATILVVDDRPINRDVLVTLLRHKDHRLLEGANGAEALDLARAERPDLIITDILMPTMDGYEFVRQLRAEPALAHIPVIFYTAHYLEEEAHSLAKACGVAYVLTKPSKPAAILETVETALVQVPSPPQPLLAEPFDREHLRLVTDKLAQKVAELQRTNKQLAILLELSQQLTQEHDPERLVANYCQAAREITGAACAGIGLWDENQTGQHFFYPTGLEADPAAQLKSVLFHDDELGRAGREGGVQRFLNRDGDPAALGLPPEHPPVYSFLAVPLVSATQSYGWLYLGNKLGETEFSEADERLLTMLATQLTVAYENARLYLNLEQHTAELEEEVAERRRAEARLTASLREKEVLLREVNHRVRNNLQGILSLLYLQTTHVPESSLRRLFQQTEDRVRSIALVHEKLFQAQDLAELDLGEYAYSLAQHLMSSHGVDPARVALVVKSDRILVTMDSAIPLGVILTELISNALKHAFPGGENSKISITLRWDSHQQLSLTVADNGIGIPADVDVTRPKTLGLQLVNMLTGYMQGTVELEREGGTCFTITCQLQSTQTSET